MAGLYINDSSVKTSIQSWANKIFSPNGKWEGNNLHIDEIDSLNKITRSQWIHVSFMILNILENNIIFTDSLILFLHIELKYSIENKLDKLSLDWLKDNLHEYTPPSFNFTSLEYYSDFYEKELVTCTIDKSIIELIHSSPNLDFFYRTFYDEDEEMFSREIYIFVKGREPRTA